MNFLTLPLLSIIQKNLVQADEYPKQAQEKCPFKALKPIYKHPLYSELCQHYTFTTIGGYLYIELFKGLELHYLPKKCGYCEKFFLLTAGLFSDYCTREIEGMDGRTCRDMGHRKKYADKIKNNPCWNVYSKAYKQHYARYMKRKMTQTEFAEWADYALELRSKAENGEIEFEVYVVEIRK